MAYFYPCFRKDYFMKIEQVRSAYSYQIKSYNEQIHLLTEKKQKLDEQIKKDPNGQALWGDEAATLELTINKLDEKNSQYKDYMEKLMEQHTAIANMEVAKQQGDAMAEGMEDMGKIMEVARRIMKGDIVPPSDERRLMEFDDELYQAAKNIGRMRQRLEEQKEHESLWEDEEPKEYADPMEVADNSEAFGAGPEIVSVEETMASVEVPTE